MLELLITFLLAFVLIFDFFLALKGGHLDSEYELWQFHAHWGNEDKHGSEHTVDGKTFASEVRISRVQSEKTEKKN